MHTTSRSIVCAVALGIFGAAQAQTGSQFVDARSNIFGYGLTTPNPGGGGGGVVAPKINLSAGTGRTITFSASGSATWGLSWPATGPDGLLAGPSGNPFNTNLNSVGPVSSFSAPLHGHLLGLFIEAGDISGLAAPTGMTYADTGSLQQATYSPGLRQVFVIGDGLTGTGSGTTQVFNVPDSAVALVVGVADGFNFTGQTGYYDDNAGGYSLNYSAVPEPGAWAVVGFGLVLIPRRRKP